MSDDYTLPDGWSIEGLWDDDRRVLEYKDEYSDWDVLTADAIVIKYEDELGVDYRTVHGALDLEHLGDLIETQIEPDSPVR
jgi:hypothetical protein